MPDASFRTVGNTVVNGVILIDGQGSVLAFNKTCERLFGYSDAEIVGRNIGALIAAPFRESRGRDIEHCLRTGVQREFPELIGQRKDGGTFAMELSLGAAHPRCDAICVFIAASLIEHGDLDAQRLAAANEELGRFARDASHDLHEPLRMVSMFCGLLSERYGDRLDAQGREYLQLAARASERMRHLLDDLRDYGQLDLAERDCWFECGDCFAAALENLQELIRESGATIVVGATPRVFGNPIRFTRLAQNLLANAVKYVAPKVPPRVSIAAETCDAYWRFSIADNGVGIDARHYGQVFESFKRLHAGGERQGSGLGLAICRRIVDGFGGSIDVASTIGEGSTFTFTVKRPVTELMHG